jgi:hypothetical protein
MSKGPNPPLPRKESFELEEQEVGESTCWVWYPAWPFLLEDVMLSKPDVNLDVFMVTVHNVMLGRWGKHVPLCTPNERIMVTVGYIRPPFPEGKPRLRTGIRLTGTFYEGRATVRLFAPYVRCVCGHLVEDHAQRDGGVHECQKNDPDMAARELVVPCECAQFRVPFGLTSPHPIPAPSRR